MKIVLPVSLAMLAVGVLVGRSLPRHDAADVSKAGSAADAAGGTAADPAGAAKKLEERAIAAEAKVKEREADLAKAQGELKALKAKETAAKTTGETEEAPAGADAVAKKIAALREKVKAAVEKKDGKALVKLMHQFAALGEAGYMDAIEVSGILSEDAESGKGEFGLSQGEFYMAFGKEMVPVSMWALANPDKAPKGYRIGAAYSLPWAQGIDAPKTFIDTLKNEKDPDVAAVLASQLAMIAKPELIPDLRDAALAAADNPSALGSILDSLSAMKAAESEAALRELAGSDNPAVQSAAEIALIGKHPPAPGVMITYTAPNSQAETAGLKRGDIIVSYGGKDMTSMDELTSAIHGTSAEELVTVMVNRGGELMTIQVKGQKMGINGRYVSPTK